MGRLDGRVAIVTGAGRGIGKAIAKRFAAEGAKVAVVSLTPAKIKETVDEVTGAGGTAIGIQCDIRDADAIKAAVAKTAEAFGTVDILVNNAHPHVDVEATPVSTMTADQIHAQMEGGPIAALRFMQSCYPHMEASGGRVINMATMIGVRGVGLAGAFAIAKESLRTLTRVAAREWAAKGITVNAMCPFAITDGLMGMGSKVQAVTGQAPPPPQPPPVGRIGSAEEDIAPVALFLASEDSRYMTGYTFMADGGGAIDAAR